MKLPEIKTVKEVANYYGISTKGKLVKWLQTVNQNAAIYYYSEGNLKHIRVRSLLKLLNN